MPPRGLVVELGRLEYYLKRAAETRYSDDGKEKMPTYHEEDFYNQNMTRIFAQRPPPRTFTEGDMFVDGHLRKDRFLLAFQKLNPTSTPGFPYLNIATNNQLDPAEVYTEVDSLLIRWLNTDNLYDLSPEELFIKGICPPAHVFIKGEPTKQEKIARLIYGVSVLMNIIARILFGDYLQTLSETWYTASHKVGLDFNSEPGLAKFSQFTKTLDQRLKDFLLEGHDYEMVSDDIQGWEYQVRDWMHDAWHKAYLNACDATPFHRKIQGIYAYVEKMTFVKLCTGELVRLPFYIRMSGVVTTHIQNSDERAALADTDFCFEAGIEPASLGGQPTCMTNGDDCIRMKKSQFTGSCFSERMGFVHTDVQIEDLDKCFHFSSQEFFYDGEQLLRKPDTLVKSAFNLIEGDDNDSSYFDTLIHCIHHPAVHALHALAQSLQLRFPGKGA